LNTTPCEAVVSSGITQPFGWLSRSPGHVSDSLLSRSPLGVATPCDLHVLATPPAFRLSQDQTLQLNFLARDVPDARCDPCGLTGTDTFTTRVGPRNEFVQTRWIKTFSNRLLLPLAGKGSGSARLPPALANGLRRDLQGSNIFDGLLKQNDQGRSLTCVHHEDA
jgi:hypothetical protein